MKRGVLTTVLLVVASALFPNRADSAGVYENAAAESAFLLAPQRVVLRASLEVSREDSLDGTVYRFYAAFPIKTMFLVAVEQSFVSVSDSSEIDSGLGDLMVRMRGRLLGEKHVLWAVGTLGAGTGEQRLFPYSSESVDIGLSLAFTDSLGALDLFATAGYVWAQRLPKSLEGVHDNYSRVSAGAGVRIGRNGGVRAGVTSLNYALPDTRRDLVFAGAGYRWSESLHFFAEGQVETGPVAARASDWAVTAGIAVRF